MVKVEMKNVEGHEFFQRSEKGAKPVRYNGKLHVIIGQPVRNFMQGGSWEFRLAPYDKRLHGVM